MAYLTPKAALNAYLVALRAHTWPAALTPIVFRKGPQRALKLDGTEKAICIIALEKLEGGEVSAGAGNHWWHNWGFKVVLLVPDDEDAPEASEDARLDLIDEFAACLHANRTLTDGTAEAKVGKVDACELSIGTLFENTQQVFRAATITTSYKTLKA